MARKHSWNWLPTRVTHFRPATPSLSRPPLPIFESLEDRVLLSASEGGVDQVLIGLLRGQIGVRNAEIETLKLAGNLVEDKTTPLSPLADAFLKIEGSLLDIDGALVKIAESSLLGHKTDTDIHMIKMNLAFAKIDEEVKLFGENGQGLLLPAVQRIREAANSALKFASSLPAVQKSDHKISGDFIKFENAFLKIGDITDKTLTADLDLKLTQDKWRTDLLKLDEAFVKLDADAGAMGDGSVFKALSDELDALKVNTLNFLTSFVNPDTGGDGGGGTITITLTDPEGDVIS